MAKQINPNLRKLAELTCNPDLAMPDLDEIIEETPLKTNKLERDTNGKPIVKLTPLEKIAVNILIQKEYNALMQVYECGGWMWVNGVLPTEVNHWGDNKDEGCVDAGITIEGNIKERFRYGPRGYKEARGYQVIPTQEFYNKQNITDDMLKEINEYFENER